MNGNQNRTLIELIGADEKQAKKKALWLK